MTIRFSHSQVETFKKCPYKYYLQYVLWLKTIPNFDANNPLILGSALHKAVESGMDAGLKLYHDFYPGWSNLHEEEDLKLRYWIPKLLAKLPEGKHEVKVENRHFVGYLDLLVSTTGGPTCEYDLYDFKYSNNVNSYLDSGQLHEYKYFFETTHKDYWIRNMYFVFIPKFFIRQKKTETLYQFRQRLQAEMAKKDIQIVDVPYDASKVIQFYKNCQDIQDCEDDGQEQWFPKRESRLCDFCEYKDYCQKGEDYMLLPKNERRSVNAVNRKRIWIYGAPFSGKTYFANKFPNVLMLNTDGNVRFVDAPFIAIKDVVVMEGRIEKRTLAWDLFKQALDELEKKKNDYQTIVVDLLEDCYESCRLYMYEKLGITHESDDSFRAWDKVRTEFLSTMRRLLNLDYDTIILISHEDTTKDFTKRSGDKISTIKPNLSDKPALKIAGMVDIVARVVNDGDKRTLEFKSNDVVFGGGRLSVNVESIPLEVEALDEVYDEANKALKNDDKKVIDKKQVEKHEPTSQADDKRVPDPGATVHKEPENSVPSVPTVPEGKGQDKPAAESGPEDSGANSAGKNEEPADNNNNNAPVTTRKRRVRKLRTSEDKPTEKTTEEIAAEKTYEKAKTLFEKGDK